MPSPTVGERASSPMLQGHDPEVIIWMPAPANPLTLLSATRQEYARLFQSPWTDLGVIIGNAALMCGAWFLVPPGLQSWLFSLHGAVAFPLVLEMWMLADTPATNVLAADASAALSVLDDHAALRRWLWAKHLALASLVAPVCALVVVVVALAAHDGAAAFPAAVILAVLPLGVLAISAWLGILWPYHPRPLRWRLAQRQHVGRVLVRWTILLVTPYAAVPAVALVLAAPTLGLWVALRGNGPHPGRLTDAQFTLGAVVLTATVFAAMPLASRGALWMIARRRHRLVAYLTEPELG
jgi:hypothetical protein